MPKLISFIASLSCLTLALSGCSKNDEQAKSEVQKPLYQNFDDIPAQAFLDHQEVYNPESVIPPQCYTKTDSVNNPCYICHQSYPNEFTRTNLMGDGDLQGNYEFSDVGLSNSWKNLFKDRSELIAQISDQEIQNWTEQDNYSSFIQDLQSKQAAKQWRGEVAAIENLAYPEKAFDDNGLALDNSQWVAYNYKPLPSTFWPTNGSTGDAMIRLAAAFRQQQQQESFDVYFANLALVEMALKDLPQISTPPISEKVIGRDLNGNNKLEDKITIIKRQQNYVGDASQIALAHMLYPAGTEFLHTVRYIGIKPNGELYNAPRMKEVRYMRKAKFRSQASIAAAYYSETKEKQFEQLPQTVYLGDQGISNGFGWIINGYIEDQQGQLRPQQHQELAFCNGCHKTVGSTLDQTFSFARKVEGEAGWGYIDLKAMSDVPNINSQQGEFLTYFERVNGGDEFRQNQEMLSRWFTPEGKVDHAKVKAAGSLYELIMPSKERALKLNKTYKTIVAEQSYIFGRDATWLPSKNVLQQVDDSQAPLQADKQYSWDIRLDWH